MSAGAEHVYVVEHLPLVLINGKEDYDLIRDESKAVREALAALDNKITIQVDGKLGSYLVHQAEY